MNQFCRCCSSCKPRYKRLVDHVYPHSAPFDSPIASNMQKLTFYSISHPEKLNRIGQYLVQRLARDLGRQRVADVKVAVDAMEHLLKSCHGSPSLNQFIESYLLMVQRLLETNDPQMEKMATDLFVRFSGIEEDSPSYHRQYDFFISKFSSMCHANQGAYSRSQRFNGLRGLRGVIWKSTSDDLQANIWEKQHMNKIIPSILYNFQNENNDESDQFDELAVDHKTSMLFHHYPEEESATSAAELEPMSLALQCLRELFQKCSFGSLKSVLEPVFKHFDLHSKWIPPPIFAIKTFRAILYSIQSQNSYFVIQELINHLEQVPSTEAQIRVGMATVLASIVCIAGSSIGPLLLAIFNALLKLLRSSVEFQQSKQCSNLEAERNFQDTLINALGDFASALPDYQKVEIMLFTAGSIPNILDSTSTGNISIKLVQTGEAFLQKVLVKTLHKVATKYKTFYLATIFTDAFLKTLLQLQLSRDAEVRFIAHQIFHTLLDRHENLPKLEHLPYVPDLQTDLELKVEKSSRQDQLFMRRHIHLIISTLYRSVNMADQGQSISLRHQLDAILCSISLLCIEVGNDETHCELLRLAFALQQMALENQQQQNQLLKRATEVHNMVARFMNFCSQLLSIPAFCQHVQQVIKMRSQHPALNILNANDPQNVEIEQQGAYSPPQTNKAPIAHMDSEEEVLSGRRGGRVDEMNDENEKPTEELVNLAESTGWLFSAEIVFEAIKASNKEAQRLTQPFRPLAMSQSMGNAQPGLMLKTIEGNDGIHPTSITITSAPSTEKHELNTDQSTTTTSGGLMFTTSPLNSRRNLSAMEINVLLNGSKGEDGQKEMGTAKSDTELQKTNAGSGLNTSKQSSFDNDGSIGSSSVDWSPPDSNVHSRRNTYYGGGQQQQQNMELPITVEQLRVLANTPLDLNEEDIKDQEKSRKVLEMFRGKDAKQLSVLFRKSLHRRCSSSSIGSGQCTHPEGECNSSAGAGEETLAQTLQRLNTRHDEKTKIRLFGQQAQPATIFEIKFPSSFEF